MGNDMARPVRAIGHDPAAKERGGAGCNDRIRTRSPVDPGEKVLFEGFVLGGVLLNEVGLGNSALKARREGQAAGFAVPKILELRRRASNECDQPGFSTGRRVGCDHIITEGQKEGGPAGSHGSATHNGDRLDGAAFAHVGSFSNVLTRRIGAPPSDPGDPSSDPGSRLRPGPWMHRSVQSQSPKAFWLSSFVPPARADWRRHRGGC